MTFIRWMCRLIGINASFLSFLSLAGLKHVPGMEELMLVQFMKCVIQKRKAVTALPLRKIWTILAKWGIKFLWSWWVMYIWKYLFVFTHLVLIKGSTLSCQCKTKWFKSNTTNMSWCGFFWTFHYKEFREHQYWFQVTTPDYQEPLPLLLWTAIHPLIKLSNGGGVEGGKTQANRRRVMENR